MLASGDYGANIISNVTLRMTHQQVPWICPNTKSDFLGDPPQTPVFYSLGTLTWAELHHWCVVDLFGGFWRTHDSSPSEARKRGSGGGSPRMSDDDPPAGPLDLS
jgi:hypothetical protein